MNGQRPKMAVGMVDGTRYDLRIMPGDIVKTERQYQVSANEIDRDPKLEHLLYMAWMAAKRHGFTGTYDEFVDQVDDIDIATEAANPSPPAP